MHEPVWTQWPKFDKLAIGKAMQEFGKSGRWDMNYRRSEETEKAAEEVQKEIADFAGMEHCLLFDSGSSAISVSCEAVARARKGKSVELTPEDIFIVPSFTYRGTDAAVLKAGGSSAIVDVNEKTYTLDPNRVADVMNPRVLGVIPVAIFGLPADTEALLQVIKDASEKYGHKIFLISDNCQAPDATEEGRMAGANGDIVTLSLQQSKQLTAGAGGVILTNDDKLAEYSSDAYNKGRAGFEGDIGANTQGMNHRFHGAIVSIVSEQLKLFPKQIRNRTINMLYLSSLLWHEGALILPPFTPGCGLHIYALRVPPEIRDEFVRILKEEYKIPTVSPGYSQTLHQNPDLQNSRHIIYPCPVTEAIQESQVWFKHQLFLSENAQQGRRNMRYLANAILETLTRLLT